MKLHPVFDATANDSDKSWTVPTGKSWELQWAHTILASTATVGNRQLSMSIVDDNSNLMMDVHAGAVQAASLSYHYEFMQGIFRETSFVAGAIQVPAPKNLILLPGWSIRFYDEAAVDAAADDLTVAFLVKERAVG